MDNLLSQLPTAAPGVAATILLAILLRLWLMERAHHTKEREAIITAYQRRIDSQDVAHARELRDMHAAHVREVQTWRRRLRDCENQFEVEHLSKRWYDQDSDRAADEAAGEVTDDGT